MDDKKLEKDIMVEGKVKKEGEDMPEKMNDKIEVKEKGNVPQEDAFKDKFKSLKTKAAENNKENKENKEQEDGGNDHLQKMRLQMLAQKNLSKELMKKNTANTQPKVPGLAKSVVDLGVDIEEVEKEDRENELNELKVKVESLLSENDKYKEMVENLVKAKTSEEQLSKQVEELAKVNEVLTTDNNLKEEAYQKLSEDNKKKDEKIKKLNNDIKNKEAKNQELVKKNKEAQEAIANLEKGLPADNNERKELEKANKKLTAENTKLLEEKLDLEFELDNKVRSLEKELASSKAKLEKAKAEVPSPQLLDELAGLKKELSSKLKEIEKLQKEKEAIDNKLEESKESLKEAKKQIDKLQKKDQAGALEELKKTNAELKKQVASKEKEVEKANLAKEKVIEDSKACKKEVSNLNKQLGLKEKEIEKLVSEKEKDEAKREKLVKENEKLANDVTKAKAKNEKLTNDLASAKEKNDELNKSIEETNDKNNKAIERWKNRLMVAEEGYLVAVEERVVNEEKLAIAYKEKTDELNKALKEAIEQNNSSIDRWKKRLAVAEEGYLVAIQERLASEESLSNALKEAKETISQLTKEKEELEADKAYATSEIVKLNQEKEKLVNTLEAKELAEKQTFDVALEEEVKNANEDVELMKQRELINLRREEEKSLEEIIINYELNEQKEMAQENLTEEAILDPEFKIKIRSVREMKKELLANIDVEKKQYSKNFEDVNQRILAREQEIKSAIKKVEELDREYEGTTNRTSLVREQYTSKRSKAIIAIDSIKSKLNTLKDEYANVKKKYDDFMVRSDEKLASMNKAEMDIINYYLNRIVDVPTLQEETKDDFNSKEAEKKARRLEQEIIELNNELKVLSNKLAIISNKQDERLDSKYKVEQADKYIALYANISEDLQGYLSYKREVETIIDETKQEILLAKDKVTSKYEMVRLNAKLQDLINNRNDLQSKVEYQKQRLTELSSNSRVKYYIDLVNSMDELNAKYHLIKSQMDIIDVQIKEKKDELNKIREKLREE